MGIALAVHRGNKICPDERENERGRWMDIGQPENMLFSPTPSVGEGINII